MIIQQGKCWRINFEFVLKLCEYGSKQIFKYDLLLTNNGV